MSTDLSVFIFRAKPVVEEIVREFHEDKRIIHRSSEKRNKINK